MNEAINILQIALRTMENNEPINRAEGNLDQADLESRTASSIRQALAVLTPTNDPLREAVFAKEVADEMRAKEAAHAARQ